MSTAKEIFIDRVKSMEDDLVELSPLHAYKIGTQQKKMCRRGHYKRL